MKIKFFVAAKSDYDPDLDLHGSALVWLSGSRPVLWIQTLLNWLRYRRYCDFIRPF